MSDNEQAGSQSMGHTGLFVMSLLTGQVNVPHLIKVTGLVPAFCYSSLPGALGTHAAASTSMLSSQLTLAGSAYTWLV